MNKINFIYLLDIIYLLTGMQNRLMLLLHLIAFGNKTLSNKVTRWKDRSQIFR